MNLKRLLSELMSERRDLAKKLSDVDQAIKAVTGLGGGKEKAKTKTPGRLYERKAAGTGVFVTEPRLPKVPTKRGPYHIKRHRKVCPSPWCNRTFNATPNQKYCSKACWEAHSTLLGKRTGKDPQQAERYRRALELGIPINQSNNRGPGLAYKIKRAQQAADEKVKAELTKARAEAKAERAEARAEKARAAVLVQGDPLRAGQAGQQGS